MIFSFKTRKEAKGWTYTEKTSGSWDADQMSLDRYNLFGIFGFTF
jgi:hypothetical protein